MIRFERRLEQPRWLVVAVPVGSIVVAFLFAAVVLAATGHNPLHTYRRLFDSAFLAKALSRQTLVSATPLAFTGLAAAAFRMSCSTSAARASSTSARSPPPRPGSRLGTAAGPVVDPGDDPRGLRRRRGLGLIPAILRAFLKTNEIVTSLMLNYVAASSSTT